MSRPIAVLRPEPGNRATAAAIEARGYRAIRLPLFEVRPLAWEVPDPARFDALLLTSANAVRHAGAALSHLLALPVYAVGDATAEAARQAGFRVAATGETGAEALVARAETAGVRHALHLAGRERTLAPGGIVAEVATVYASESMPAPPDVVATLARSIVLVQSARAGARLAEVVPAASRGDIALVATSQRAAVAAGPGWEHVVVLPDFRGTAPIDAAIALTIDRGRLPGEKGRMSDEPLAPQSPLRNRILVGGLGFLGGVALTAGLIQVTGMPMLHPAAPAPPTSSQPRPAAAPALPPGTDMATLNAREAELAGRLDQLEQRIADTSGSARNAATYATQAERLMIAFSTRRSIERGQPLGALENQLRARFGEEHAEAVAAIVAAAAQPVTLEDLRLALDTIAPRLASGPNDSLWARFRGFIGDMIVVRQAEMPSPRTADRLRRARRALDQGEVEASLAEVAHLPGAANAESWTGAARRFLAARNGLNEIERAAVETAPAQPARPAI